MDLVKHIFRPMGRVDHERISTLHRRPTSTGSLIGFLLVISDSQGETMHRESARSGSVCFLAKRDLLVH